MWKICSGVLSVLLTASLAVSGYLYTRNTALEKSIFEAELSLMRKHRDDMAAVLDVRSTVETERGRDYDAIHEAARETAVATAMARSGPGGIDIDALLPVSLTDSRWLLYDKACADDACGYAKPASLRAKADAEADRGQGAADNAASVATGK